jgi:hypothetical protein
MRHEWPTPPAATTNVYFRMLYYLLHKLAAAGLEAPLKALI